MNTLLGSDVVPEIGALARSVFTLTGVSFVLVGTGLFIQLIQLKRRGVRSAAVIMGRRRSMLLSALGWCLLFRWTGVPPEDRRKFVLDAARSAQGLAKAAPAPEPLGPAGPSSAARPRRSRRRRRAESSP